MKHKLSIMFWWAAVATVLIAQDPFLLPVWTGKTYTYPRLGPTLSIANGQIDALIPPPVPGAQGPAGPQGPSGTARRHVDVLLPYNATAAGWTLPVPAQGFTLANLALYVNGLRYHAGIDFSANGGIVKALANNMDQSFLVTCDYEEQ